MIQGYAEGLDLLKKTEEIARKLIEKIPLREKEIIPQLSDDDFVSWEIMRFFFINGCRTFLAIQLLVDKGLYINALKEARSLYELFLRAADFQRDPNSQMFRLEEYYWRLNRFAEMNAPSKWPTEILSKYQEEKDRMENTCSQIEQNLSSSEISQCKQRAKNGFNIKELSEKIEGPNSMYFYFYRYPSSFTHSSASSAKSFLEMDRSELEKCFEEKPISEAEEREFAMVVAQTFSCFTKLCAIASDYFEIPFPEDESLLLAFYEQKIKSLFPQSS